MRGGSEGGNGNLYFLVSFCTLKKKNKKQKNSTGITLYKIKTSLGKQEEISSNYLTRKGQSYTELISNLHFPLQFYKGGWQ